MSHTFYWPQRILRLSLLSAILCLHGCAQSIVTQQRLAVSQDSRVQVIVIHATEETFEDSLKILTTGDVSSHYLIRRQPAEVWQLVDENRRAWHAGTSSWQGRTALNSASIGIELVSTEHRGIKEEPFTAGQIKLLITLLQDIERRHHVRPDRIVGHGEIQPDHKTDPGRLFPWPQLAEAGLIPWPDPSLVAQAESQWDNLPDVAWWQAHLQAAGYDCPQSLQWDAHTLKVLQVFRDKYEPNNATLPLSAHTAALLSVVTAKEGLRLKDPQGQWQIFRLP